MIDFRYHVVSVTALFLALAAGIALGAGPLQDPVSGELSASSSTDEELRSQLERSQQISDFQAAYGAGTANLVLGDRLAGTSVALLLLPGADRTVVQQLVRNVGTAGAEVTSTLSLTDDLVDPANRQLAESLVARVLRDVETVDTPSEASGYELVGSALGRAVLTRSTGQVEPDASAERILSAFEAASFLVVDGAVEQRAQLALVVAGDPASGAPEGQADVAAALAAGLDRAAGGTVVAGTTGSADTGAVSAVRSTQARSAVSTVDPVETATGRLVAVLALAEQAAGGTGQYGPEGSDGALPALGG